MTLANRKRETAVTTDDIARSETSIWVESLVLNFQEALDFMEAAVRDCPDDLWLTNMWEVPDPDAGTEIRDTDGALITDHAERHALVQRHRAPRRTDLLGYVGYCRQRVAHGLKELTEERAMTRLSGGRHQGKPYAWRLMQMMRHVTEHASQIRQFITAAGITSDPGAG